MAFYAPQAAAAAGGRREETGDRSQGKHGDTKYETTGTQAVIMDIPEKSLWKRPWTSTSISRSAIAAPVVAAAGDVPMAFV